MCTGIRILVIKKDLETKEDELVNYYFSRHFLCSISSEFFELRRFPLEGLFKRVSWQVFFFFC